tara:strand:- start:9 stop:1790 length:1782 start_codon:yes stop_codon:yes gene_type:complete
MIFINLFHNIIIFFGLSFLGSLILFKINLADIYKDKVLNLFFYFIIGFIFVSILIYIVSLYNFYIINITYGINFILIIFSIIKINKDKLILREISKFFYSDKILIIFFIILIFYSLMPATDADSLAYHFDIPKKIFESGSLSFNGLHYHEIFYGPGEAFYLLGAVINNYQLPHFINFLALIIIYSIFRDKFLKNKYIRKQKIFLYTLLSVPVIFQLFSTGKPQLIFIAINLFFFSIIFNNNFQDNFFKKNILSFFFLMLLSFLGVILSKITFTITCFILMCYFLIKNRLIFKFFNFYYLITFFLGLSCLILYQKYLVYGDYSFYFLKLNNINFENNFIDFLNKIKVSNNYQNFPLNLFFPITGTVLLDNLGYISIFIFSFFIFSKNNNLEKFIIIICILLLYLTGLKHARFYAEILLFCSYVLISDYKFFSKYKKYFLIKILAIPQLLYIVLFLFYLGYLDTKIFSSNLKINYLRDNAFGYSMNEFLNSNIKDKSKILIDYRSLFYSKHEIYYLESLKFGDLNDKTIFSIKKIKPDYIVNIGTQKTLSACQGQKILEKYLKVNASRNPIKKIKSNIKVSVYKFNSNSKECLIK